MNMENIKTEIELPSIEELDRAKEIVFLDRIDGFVLKQLEEKNKDQIVISIEELRITGEKEEFGEKEIELVTNFFNKKRVTVTPYTDGETNEKYLQFTVSE